MVQPTSKDGPIPAGQAQRPPQNPNGQSFPDENPAPTTRQLFACMYVLALGLSKAGDTPSLWQENPADVARKGKAFADELLKDDKS